MSKDKRLELFDAQLQDVFARIREHKTNNNNNNNNSKEYKNKAYNLHCEQMNLMWEKAFYLQYREQAKKYLLNSL